MEHVKYISDIQLPEPSASSVTYKILSEALSVFSSEFPGFELPRNFETFSRTFDDYLTEFEIARALSPKRKEIAKFINDSVQRCFYLVRDGVKIPLEEFFSTPTHSTLSREFIACDNRSELPKRGYHITYKNQIYNGHEQLRSLVDAFLRRHVMTDEAATALKKVVDKAFIDGIDLRGQKFALLGGTAELSPISFLLAAGADVFTTCRGPVDPLVARIKKEVGPYPGRLFFASERGDILQHPDTLAATIAEFAADRKVHVGAFAYKGGQGMEWRLTAAMDGIIRKLIQSSAVATVIYYLSPSVVTEVSEKTACLSLSAYHRANNIGRKLLRALSWGRLGARNIRESKGRYWVLSMLPFQGCSYAAANLFGKNYAAEAYMGEVTVSANVAPITNTGTMQSDIIQLAFAQAERRGIEIFQPESTRAILNLLMLSDWRGEPQGQPQPPFPKQVHGGVFTHPFSLKTAMAEAYVTARIRKAFRKNQESHIDGRNA